MQEIDKNDGTSLPFEDRWHITSHTALLGELLDENFLKIKTWPIKFSFPNIKELSPLESELEFLNRCRYSEQENVHRLEFLKSAFIEFPKHYKVIKNSLDTAPGSGFTPEQEETLHELYVLVRKLSWISGTEFHYAKEAGELPGQLVTEAAESLADMILWIGDACIMSSGTRSPTVFFNPDSQPPDDLQKILPALERPLADEIMTRGMGALAVTGEPSASRLFSSLLDEELFCRRHLVQGCLTYHSACFAADPVEGKKIVGKLHEMTKLAVKEGEAPLDIGPEVLSVLIELGGEEAQETVEAFCQRNILLREIYQQTLPSLLRFAGARHISDDLKRAIKYYKGVTTEELERFRNVCSPLSARMAFTVMDELIEKGTDTFYQTPEFIVRPIRTFQEVLHLSKLIGFNSLMTVAHGFTLTDRQDKPLGCAYLDFSENGKEPRSTISVYLRRDLEPNQATKAYETLLYGACVSYKGKLPPELLPITHHVEPRLLAKSLKGGGILGMNGVELIRSYSGTTA